MIAGNRRLLFGLEATIERESQRSFNNVMQRRNTVGGPQLLRTLVPAPTVTPGYNPVALPVCRGHKTAAVGWGHDTCTSTSKSDGTTESTKERWLSAFERQSSGEWLIVRETWENLSP